jgi:glucosamine-6-phosphate deaminase
MIVHVYDTGKLASLAAAHLFAAQILEKPHTVMGLATGSTPVDTYKQLAQWFKEGLLDFSECISFNLDEYVGLSPDHVCSYRRFMEENLFNHINMKETNLPSGTAANLKAECRRYDKAIQKAGGIDIQFLGIGHNGHIGFNEPDSVFSHGTHVVKLTESTIQANKRYFDSEDQVPRQAISLGIGGIMQARKIVLVALGEGKAKAIRQMVKGNADPQCQASILKLHPQVTVLLDEAAASLL